MLKITPDKLHSLTPGTEYNLTFTADLLHGNSKANVYCPQYHRSKIASYWCVVGLKGEVLAVKKIILSGAHLSCVIPIKMPGTLPPISVNNNNVMTDNSDNSVILNVHGKVTNPNDKLYMNYKDDYQQLQKQQQELKNNSQQNNSQQNNSQNQQKQPQLQNEKDMTQIYLISDSILGLDDVVDLPYSLSV